MTVHVVGNAGIDTTFELARLPRPGETLNARAGRRGLGGKGANQAVATARCGVLVALHAAIGGDDDGRWVAARLAEEGLDLAGLVIDQDAMTDASAILVDAAGENAIASLVERARGFDPLAAGPLASGLAPGDILLMQGNLPLGVTLDCLTFAKARGAITIVNASPLEEEGNGVTPIEAAGEGTNLSEPADGWRFDHVDHLVINALEARCLGRAEAPEAAARQLQRRGAGHVVVSLGREGAILLDPGGTVERFAAAEVEAIDTSGAGDVLCGVYAGRIAQGLSSARALRDAVAAAGVAVTRRGTLESCPSAAEIAALSNS